MPLSYSVGCVVLQHKMWSSNNIGISRCFAREYFSIPAVLPLQWASRWFQLYWDVNYNGCLITAAVLITTCWKLKHRLITDPESPRLCSYASLFTTRDDPQKQKWYWSIGYSGWLLTSLYQKAQCMLTWFLYYDLRLVQDWKRYRYVYVQPYQFHISIRCQFWIFFFTLKLLNSVFLFVFYEEVIIIEIYTLDWCDCIYNCKQK